MTKALSLNPNIIKLILRQPNIIFANSFISLLNRWLINNQSNLSELLNNSLIEFRQNHKYDNDEKTIRKKEEKDSNLSSSLEDELFHSDNDNDFSKFNSDIYKDDDDSEPNIITRNKKKKKKTINFIDDDDDDDDADADIDDTDDINIESDEEIDILRNSKESNKLYDDLDMDEGKVTNKDGNNKLEINIENDDDEIYLYSLDTPTSLNSPLKDAKTKTKKHLDKSTEVKNKNGEKKYYTPTEITIILENIRKWRSVLSQIKKNLTNMKTKVTSSSINSAIPIESYNIFNNSELITNITSLIYEFSLHSQFNDLLTPENGK